MKFTRTERILALLVCALALVATLVPALDHRPATGPTTCTAVTGNVITLYGIGPYRNMPADLAIQGIAQDWVTLLVAIPLLAIVVLVPQRDDGRTRRIFLAGLAGYFLVQYTMYLAMATYGELFMVWTALAGFSLHLFILAALPLAKATVSPDTGKPGATQADTGRKRAARVYVGWFLLINGTLMALLWLSVIVPPLMDGSLYPAGLAHLTTMVVQGLDLAFFLPPSLLAGWSYLTRRGRTTWLAPVYTVFLSLQMTALLAKIVGMSMQGVSAGPALVLIPVLLCGSLAAMASAVRLR